MSIPFINECLQEYKFEKVEFVVEPGQYSVRGGIIDVFSYSNEDPFRIEFFDKEIESIRTFDLNSQRSKKQITKASIVPNIQTQFNDEEQQSILKFLDKETIIWIKDSEQTKDKLNDFYNKAIDYFLAYNKEYGVYPDTLYYIGFSYENIDDIENAILFYQIALELEPKNININKQLADIYFKENKISLVKEILHKLKDCNCKEYNEIKNIIAKN